MTSEVRNHISIGGLGGVFYPNDTVATFTAAAVSCICSLDEIVPFSQFEQFLHASKEMHFDLIVMHCHDESRNYFPLKLREQGVANCPLVVTYGGEPGEIFGRISADDKRFDALLEIPFNVGRLTIALKMALSVWGRETLLLERLRSPLI